MKGFLAQPVSQIMRKPIIFPSDAKASTLLGELRRLNRFEALVESRSKTRIVTLLDLLKVSNPSRTLIGRIARSAIPIASEAPIMEALDLMIVCRSWGLVIKEGGEVLGIVSQYDIVDRLSKMHVISASCGEVMKADVVSVEADDRLSKARSIMRGHDLPYLPVLEDGRLRGGLSIEDLVFNMIQPRESMGREDRSGASSRLWSIKVRSVMDRSPLIVDEAYPASKALERMLARNKRACLIAKDSRLLGILTPREVISHLLKSKPRSEPLIYVIGLPRAGDFVELEEVEAKLKRTLDKIFRQFKPIAEVVIDIKRRKIRGERAMYQVNARIYFPGRILNVSAQGWYLSKVIDDLCRRLSRMRSRERRRPPRGASL